MKHLNVFLIVLFCLSVLSSSITVSQSSNLYIHKSTVLGDVDPYTPFLWNGSHYWSYYAAGCYWHLGINYTDVDQSVLLSSTDHVTWTTALAIPDTWNGLDVTVDEETDIAYFAYVNDTTGYLYMRAYQLEDTGGVTALAGEQLVQADFVSSGIFHIAQDSNRLIWIAYVVYNVPYATRTFNLDGTWQTDSGFPKTVTGINAPNTVTTTYAGDFMLTALSGGKMLFTVFSGAAGDNVYGVVWNGLTFGGAETVSSGSNSNGDIVGGMMLHSYNYWGVAYFSYFRERTVGVSVYKDCYMAEYRYGQGWSQEMPLALETAPLDSGKQSPFVIDKATGKLYAVIYDYELGGDYLVSYKGASLGWSDPVLIIADGDQTYSDVNSLNVAPYLFTYSDSKALLAIHVGNWTDPNADLNSYISEVSGGGDVYVPPVLVPDEDVDRWYYRSDTHTVNGFLGYKLQEVQSATYANDSVARPTAEGYSVFAEYGARVYSVGYDGAQVELSGGSVIGTFDLADYEIYGDGLYESTWEFGGYNFLVDSIMVKVYLRFHYVTEGDEYWGDWTLRRIYITRGELFYTLPEYEWHFYYYVNGTEAMTNFLFGDGQYLSGVAFKHARADPWTAMIYWLRRGQFLRFIVTPWTYQIGDLFYGFIVLFMSVTYYNRYRSVRGVLAIAWLLGGAGSVLAAFLPTVGLRLAWFIMALALAGTLWKLFR